jgi:hypothetical protein
MTRACLVLVLALLAFSAQPAGAKTGDDGGGGDVRVAGVCSGGVTARLRLKSKADTIELRFEVERARALSTWRVAFVQERRVVWKGAARSTPRYGSFELRRLLPDLPGADTVTARAWGPGGLTCSASATLADG